MAVDHERVEVQQQGVLVGRRGVEVPGLEVEEVGVLRMDAQLGSYGRYIDSAARTAGLVLAQVDASGEAA